MDSDTDAAGFSPWAELMLEEDMSRRTPKGGDKAAKFSAAVQRLGSTRPGEAPCAV